MKCGIVGLPNVGKSSLFNILTRSYKAKVDNFPFCTIDPNIAKVDVPDYRLYHLSKKKNSKKIIYSQLEFVDIAGLTKGASDGIGLGKSFLSHIQSVDLIIHCVRCFENEEITHVLGEIDPLIDLELIMEELENSDKKKLDLEKTKKKNTSKPDLLCDKPYLIVCNGNNEELINQVKSKFNNTCVIDVEQLELIDDLYNINNNSDEKKYIDQFYNLIQTSYNQVGYISFFTCGEQETRAWRIPKGTTAHQAAGKIHSDLEKKFIFAEVTPYDKYINNEEFTLQNKEYIIQDGDVIYFRTGK